MALFGKADADLPILTRFYQVEVPQYNNVADLRRGELDRFIIVENANLRRTAAGFPLHAPNEDIGGGKGDPFGPTISTDSELSHYTILHQLAVATMDALADDSKISVQHLLQLATMFTDSDKAYHSFLVQEVPTDGHVNDVEEGDSVTFVDVRSLDAGTQLRARNLIFLEGINKRPDLRIAILRELESLFRDYPSRQIPNVKRCDECNNPFVVLRTGQQFCSRRDATRNGQRRRYALRKADC